MKLIEDKGEEDVPKIESVEVVLVHWKSSE